MVQNDRPAKSLEAVAASRPQMLSVCHVLSGDRWAGAEVQAATLLRELCRSGDLHVSAILLNEGRLADELRQAGADVKIISEASNSFAQILSKAIPFVREQRVQILHSHRYKENLLSHLIALRCGVPVSVQTKHGMPEPFRGWKLFRQFFHQQLDRWSGRLASDAIIAVSQEMAPTLRRVYGSRKVVTIRNGIDVAQVMSRLSGAEAKAKIGCKADAQVIGIVGRIEPIKRVDLFLKMAKLVAAASPDVQFVVAGDGSLLQSLIDSAQAAGLAGNVQFLGHREDIYDVLRALDVLVMCSDHEGMPMVLLEAMWLGIPVVGRAVGGIKEVLEHGRNGMSVSSAAPEDLAAACMQLLSDRLLAERVCHSAAQAVEREFSVRCNAGATLRLYRSLYKG
jgi:glycosyltransferase involved in cell wall biosynthesis